MKVKDVIAFLEERYPSDLAMPWDNPGLLVGDAEAEVTGILTALDATDEVIEKALSEGCSLIVTHHPMIFSPLHAVTEQDFIGRRVLRLAREGISLFAMHTNYDIAGMADLNAVQLGLMNADVLQETGEDENGACGIGRIGDLSAPVTLAEFADMVKRETRLTCVRVYGNAGAKITRAAVSSGAGKSAVADAIRKGADVLVTGDVDYHSGIDAVMQGLCVIDAGHYGTEYIFIPSVAKELAAAFPVPVHEAEIRQPYILM